MSDGEVALITRASSGIGQATVRLLARNGYFVALAARRTDRLRELVDQFPGHTLALSCDVTDRDQVRATVKRLLDRAGTIDVLRHSPRCGAAQTRQRGRDRRPPRYPGNVRLSY